MQFNYTDIIDSILYDQEPQAKQILESRIRPVFLEIIKKYFTNEDETAQALKRSFNRVYERLDEIEDKREFESWASNICEIVCMDMKREAREAEKAKQVKPAKSGKSRILPAVVIILIAAAAAAVIVFVLVKNGTISFGGNTETEETSEETSEKTSPVISEKEYTALEYLFGRNGAQIDYAKAKTAFEADPENSENQYYLGYMYETGCGINVDFEKAMECYQAASDLGNENADVAIGLMYLYGEGVEADTSKAADCFNKAYDDKNAAGAYGLGLLSLYSLEQDTDLNTMVDYFNECFDADMEQILQARFRSDIAYCIALGVGYKADTELAAQYFEEAFKAGYYRSGGNLGKITDILDTDSIIYDAALKAADSNNAQAEETIGNFLSVGFAVEKDESAAVEYYKKSAESKDPAGLTALAKCYAAGKGVEKDEDKALELFDQAAALGSTEALFDRGAIKRVLHSTDEELKKAGSKDMKAAAENGYTAAMTAYGKLLRNIEKTRDSALAYFQKAARLGNAEAAACVETFDGYAAGTVDNDFRLISIVTENVYGTEPKNVTQEEMDAGSSGCKTSMKGFNNTAVIACKGKLAWDGTGTVEDYIINTEMIGFKMDIDITQYTSLTFYMKGKNNGMPVVLVCSEDGEVLSEYTTEAANVSADWSAQSLDVSSLSGNVTIIFSAGCGKNTESKSNIIYSDIVLY